MVKALSHLSFWVMVLSLGAFFGIVFIWDEIKKLPSYDDFIWQINGELSAYLITIGVSLVVFITTLLILMIRKKREEKNE